MVNYKVTLIFFLMISNIFFSLSFAQSDPILIDDSFVMDGKGRYELVRKNVFIENLDLFEPVSVLPNIAGKKIDELKRDMAGWDMAVVKAFTRKYRNRYKSVEATFSFAIHFIPGGKYEGKGQYLDGISVFPNEIDVALGLVFDSSAQIISVSNIGTQDNPIASVLIKVFYSVWNGFQTRQRSDVFFLTGAGEIDKIEANDFF